MASNEERLQSIKDNILKRLQESSQKESIFVPEYSESLPVLPLELDPPCYCGGKIWYVEYTPQGRVFKVCPRCTPRRSCTVCGGSGHKFSVNKRGEKVFEPWQCNCAFVEKGVLLLNYADIPDRYINAELFDPMSSDKSDDYPDMIKKAPEKVREKFVDIYTKINIFCDNALEFFLQFRHAASQQKIRALDKYFLLLVGNVGTGKTYAAAATLKRFILDGAVEGRFVDFQKLMSLIGDSYKNKRVSEENIMRPLREVDVLVIDEFGKGRAKAEWMLEKLDDLVNSRYNERRVTIITTNYLPEEIRKRVLHLGKQAYDDYMRKLNITDFEKNEALLWYGRNFQDARFQGNPFESFWVQSLEQRIGYRMYDRLMEVGILIDFIGIPSFRKHAKDAFDVLQDDDEDSE